MNYELKHIDSSNREPKHDSPDVSKEPLILDHVPQQLHSAQHEINNLRLLNICLQSTLIRAQTQLNEYLPVNSDEEIKRNETKQKLMSLRHTDDYQCRMINPQQTSFLHFIDNFKHLINVKQQKSVNPEENSLSKTGKQINALYEMFHELNSIIHTDHNDRINQLYITLAETSRSVNQAKEILEQTIHANRIITEQKLKHKICLICIVFTFIAVFIFIIFISFRMH